MAITIKTGTALKSLLDGQAQVSGEGDTVREVLGSLVLGERVLDDTGKLRRQYQIYINAGDDIRFRQGLDTPLSAGDTLTIHSAIAGG